MKAVLAFALAVVAAITESSLIPSSVNNDSVDVLSNVNSDSIVVLSNVNSDSSDVSSPGVIEYNEVIDLSESEFHVIPPSIALPRSDFHWGFIGGADRRLHTTTVHRPAISNFIQHHTVPYWGNSNTVVTAVRAFQTVMNQGASAMITGGGIGQSFFTILFTSRVGGGIFYQVEFWGR